MKSTLYLTMLFGLAASHDALALGRIADVTVIDRETGAALSPYYHHGEYWIAGRPGARYAIAIRNRLNGRVLAVTSVDGINVISGATAGWEQTGYVFRPGERYEINGWRKTDSEIAAFTFTDIADSYAARTGRRGNVGVIGVALFREHAPQVDESSPPMIGPSSPVPEAQSLPQPAKPASAPSATPDSADGKRFESAAAPAPDTAAVARAPANVARLGTGHGEREYSFVNHTEFERLQPEPNEIIRIRYDSLENLVAMGIVRPSKPAPSPLQPFPASPEGSYVPDPPGMR